MGRGGPNGRAALVFSLTTKMAEGDVERSV